MSIQTIIEAAKKIDSVYIGMGAFDELKCRFNGPASNKEIEFFEKKVAPIPEDFKNFLKISNGACFFNSGDFSLYSIQEILKVQKEIGFQNGIYPIGYILEDYVVIKSDEIPLGNYMYAGDSYCSDEYYSLNCNFESFLDRYIISNGCNFWRWQQVNNKFNFLKD